MTQPTEQGRRGKPGRVLWILAVVFAVVAVSALMSKPKPTPEQLYGCTVAQQADNGECQ